MFHDRASSWRSEWKRFVKAFAPRFIRAPILQATAEKWQSALCSVSKTWTPSSARQTTTASGSFQLQPRISRCGLSKFARSRPFITLSTCSTLMSRPNAWLLNVGFLPAIFQRSRWPSGEALTKVDHPWDLSWTRCQLTNPRPRFSGQIN